MMPCKFCGSFTDKGEFRPGLKQVGRTRRVGSEFERVYCCQECGATKLLTGDAKSRIVAEQWTAPAVVVATLKH